MHCRYKSKEWVVRNYALHLGLRVRRRGQKLVLFKHYAPWRRIGVYSSWAQVDRAIERWGDAELLKE
jgi:hypothetical protein